MKESPYYDQLIDRRGLNLMLYNANWVFLLSKTTESQ